MGVYVNPPQGTKEEWLFFNARRIRSDHAQAVLDGGQEVPLCLIDNGTFTACAIAYSADEISVFQRPDPRPMVWYAVERQRLRDVIPGHYHPLVGLIAADNACCDRPHSKCSPE